MEQRLQKAIAAVPPGRWAVGVSGGADSTALLRLLALRNDLELIVTHVNHETRGEASDGDEFFVSELAATMGLPFESTRLSALSDVLQNARRNPSAKYRLARFAFFRAVVQEHHCRGVLLAHHHQDVIETVFQRLVRGSGFAGLKGISSESTVQGLRVVRPLVMIERMMLCAYLRSIAQRWRADESNDSDQYGRNRVRKLLVCYPSISNALENLRISCVDLDSWVARVVPVLPARFPAKALANVAGLLAREMAGRWLIHVGVPADAIDPQVLDLLIGMSRDAATPARQTFPGGLSVSRKAGWIAAAGADPPNKT